VIALEENSTDLQAQRAQVLLEQHKQDIYKRTDKTFAALMLFQWLAGIVAACWLSPRTWSGPTSHLHPHIFAAIFLGGLISLYPIYLALRHPGETFTRHVIAVGQVLMSALLIHLTGGRIETHFHIFGSLAFLAFYRDWRVLISASAVVALDHFLRGMFWPQSVYGTLAIEPWRWLEHVGWVVFEDVFLIISCNLSLREMETISHRDAALEMHNADLERQVDLRTHELQTANKRLEALATTDPLTSLLNHRAIMAALDQEMERSRRFGRPYSLVFLDLDHFKALNDGYGHAAGDTTLTEMGAVVRESLRGIDTLGRWGGEEFVAILPEADVEAGIATAERIREAVAKHPFSIGGGIHLTCSLGVACYPNDAHDLSELVETADKAMYAAKKLGRNQARWIGDPLVSAVADTVEQAGSRDEVTMVGIVEAFATLVGARDMYTGHHTDDICEISTEIALAVGLDEDEARMVGMIGKLHDVGKVAIPDAILQKSGSLTEEEWNQMRLHTVIGADVISHIPILRALAAGIRGHHERWDGKGYPDALAGEDIPLASRIVAVADAFGAMTTDRPYWQARDRDWALAEIKRCAGTQFDPTIVAILEDIVIAGPKRKLTLSIA
jgi:diguanylate cyclase (GGDEF)-like protein